MSSKIIRDGLLVRIPSEQIRRVESKEEHLAFLGEKLVEERDECAATDYQDIFEFADILQTLMDMAAIAGAPWDAIESARVLKLAERGGFTGGHIYTPPSTQD